MPGKEAKQAKKEDKQSHQKSGRKSRFSSFENQQPQAAWWDVKDNTAELLQQARMYREAGLTSKSEDKTTEKEKETEKTNQPTQETEQPTVAGTQFPLPQEKSIDASSSPLDVQKEESTAIASEAKQEVTASEQNTTMAATTLPQENVEASADIQKEVNIPSQRKNTSEMEAGSSTPSLYNDEEIFSSAVPKVSDLELEADREEMENVFSTPTGADLGTVGNVETASIAEGQLITAEKVPEEIPEAEIDAKSSNSLVYSLAATPPTLMGSGMSKAALHIGRLQQEEKGALQESLPTIQQPTGIATLKEKRKQPEQKSFIKSALAPLIKGGRRKGKSAAASMKKHEDFAPPPKTEEKPQFSSKKGIQEAALSWLRGIKTNDKGINTSPGKRPKIQLTGDANPQINENNKRITDQSVDADHRKVDRETTKDYGEQMIYPDIDREMLRPKGGLKKAITPDFEQHTNIAPDEEFRADFDEAMTAQYGDQINEQKESVAKGRTEMDAQSDVERQSTMDKIAAEDERVGALQQELQAKTKGDVAGARHDWQKENQAIRDKYENQSEEKKREIDGKINTEVNTQEQVIDKTYTDAEKESKKEKETAEKKAEAEKAKGKNQKKSWWERAKEAISDFFDKIRQAVNKIFDKLRAVVKQIINKAKEVVGKIIDKVRDFVVDLIKGFGELMKKFADLALAAFPQVRDKFKAYIDKKVDSAVATVNKWAEDLKAFANKMLDALGYALDSILAAFQWIVNFALDVMEQITLAIVELAEYFYNLIVYRIKQLATLAMLAVLVLSGFLLATMWDFLPKNLRIKALTLLFDVGIELLENAPDDMTYGAMWPLFIHLVLGFFKEGKQTVQDSPATADKIMSKASKILTGRDMAFVMYFIGGIFAGIWDGILGLIVGIWEILKFLISLPFMMIDMITKVSEAAPEIALLMSNLFGSIEQVIIQLKEGGPDALLKLKEQLSFEKLKEFLSGVGDKMRDKAEEMGHKAGKDFVVFMMKDGASADIGWMVGKLVGQIILEVVLAFFTAGIGTAIKWAGNAIRGFRAGAKFLQALTKALEILKLLGGIIMDALRWIFSGIKKAILSFQKMGQKGMAALGTAWDNVVALLRKLGEKIGMKMDDIGSLADETKHLDEVGDGAKYADDVKHLDDAQKSNKFEEAERSSAKVEDNKTKTTESTKVAKGGIKAIQAGNYTFTKTAAKHLATRPYMNSPSTITNIMKSGKGVPDQFFKGGMNYKVPGTFNGSKGIYELGINPQTNTIYHFLFKTVK